MRRRLWIAAFAGLAAVCLPGCGRGGGGQITIRYWNGFTGPDGRTMLRLVKRFNEQNPDVHVIMQRMDWSTYYNKLFVAGLGHRAPELFVIQSHALPRFASSGFVRANDDLGGIDRADIDPNIWANSQFDGKHYGLPLDIFILGMYYNKRLFREAGIARPPETRAEFMEAARKITGPGRWGFVFTNLESNLFTILHQYGGRIFSADGSRCVINNPQNVAALQFGIDLIRREKVAPSPENMDAWIGFRQGKVGMAFEGIYMLADLQKQKDLEFSGAPLPLLGRSKAAWAASHNLCLRTDLKGRELEATWRFVRFLSDNSLDWAEGGQIPVRRSLRNTERFRSMAVQSAFARQIPDVAYLPRLQFIFEYQTEFTNAVESALRGTKSPAEALALAERNINDALARSARGRAEKQAEKQIPPG